jgi:hypothetical protein
MLCAVQNGDIQTLLLTICKDNTRILNSENMFYSKVEINYFSLVFIPDRNINLSSFVSRVEILVTRLRSGGILELVFT